MAARRTVGWVERSETHRPACNHAARNDGFRFALPILHTLSSPGGRAALRQAWPPTDGLCFSSTSSSCATASGERVYGASRASTAGTPKRDSRGEKDRKSDVMEKSWTVRVDLGG